MSLSRSVIQGRARELAKETTQKPLLAQWPRNLQPFLILDDALWFSK
jgi:hypothetical protein